MDEQLKRQILDNFEGLKKQPVNFWTHDFQGYNIDYIHNYSGALRGVRLHTHIGGPSIHLDTERYALVGSWFQYEPLTTPFSHNMCDEIDDYYTFNLPLNL